VFGRWCLWKLSGSKGYNSLEPDRRVLALPSARTLRAYRNRWHAGSGVTAATITRLIEEAQKVPKGWAKNGMLVFDGITVKSGLVFDQQVHHSN
jgi:hypothetical protein